MKKGSKFPRHFYKVNIGTAMEAAANLFNNSFTRPNTIKLLVAFTSGMIPSGGDRVKLKNAMKSLKDQKIKSIAFSAIKTVFLKELTFNTYANMFVLSGYRLKAIAYRLSRYVSSKVCMSIWKVLQFPIHSKSSDILKWVLQLLKYTRSLSKCNLNPTCKLNPTVYRDNISRSSWLVMCFL